MATVNLGFENTCISVNSITEYASIRSLITL
jgi:hypothetical protein